MSVVAAVILAWTVSDATDIARFHVYEGSQLYEVVPVEQAWQSVIVPANGDTAYWVESRNDNAISEPSAVRYFANGGGHSVLPCSDWDSNDDGVIGGPDFTAFVHGWGTLYGGPDFTSFVMWFGEHCQFPCRDVVGGGRVCEDP